MSRGSYKVDKKPCVYFITDGEYVKIGVTEDLNNRLRILQTANARELAVLKTIYTDEPYELEESLHNKYNSKRVRHEWFDILEDLSDEIVHVKGCSDLPSFRYEKRYLSPEDLERILQFNSKVIGKIISLPDFPKMVIGDYVRVPADEFYEFIDTHRTIKLK